MMKKLFTIFLVFIISGCSTTSNIKTEQPFKKSLKGYSSITIKIIANSEAMNNPDYNKIKENLLSSIGEKITPKTGLQYSPADKAADLSINVEVKNFIYTSQGARIMFGIMSGKAVLNTDISLVENKTGEVLWKVHTDTSSKTTEGIFGGSTSSQIEALSDQIIKQLQGSI
jgi:hypothetical protein